MSYAIMMLAAAAGGFLQCCSGFGYSLICMAIYSLFLPVKTALVLQALMCVFAIGYYAIKQFKHINFKLYIVPTIFALAASYASLQVVYAVNNVLLKKILGISFVAIALFSIFNKDRLKLPRGFFGMASVGLISGTLGGLSNVSGPPMAIYLFQVAKSKDEYNGTIQAFFLSMTVFKTAINLSNGLITVEMLKMVPLLLVATAIGSFLGFRLFKRMNIITVKKLINIIIIFVGLYFAIF